MQGNTEILKLHKTAFLCSRKVPSSIVLKCYDWAIQQREKGNCIISGFHSQLEKDVLHYLLKGKQPIMLALARGLKTKYDPEIELALDEGRLLIISPFGPEVKRVTEKTAEVRNRMMVGMAEKVVVGSVSKEGNLHKLLLALKSELEYITL